jgi:hypothetical protein
MDKARRIIAGILLVVALAGCGGYESDNRPTTTATLAPTTVTARPAEFCPLGDKRCPDPEVTPGTLVSLAGVCGPSYNSRRELSREEKQKVLKAYNLSASTKIAEWDHLVARWAGGASAKDNIWPQVNAADAKRKDKLEDNLYNAVCITRKLEVTTAQDRMREYWMYWPKLIESPPTTKKVPTTSRAPVTTRAPRATSPLDPRYGTCKEAIAHGYGPYHQGQDPEYNWYIDRDNDGVVCER